MLRKSQLMQYILFLAILLVLNGCYGGVTITKAPVLSEKKLTFKVPKNEDILYLDSYTKGLRYSNTLRQFSSFIGSRILNVVGIEINSIPAQRLMIVTNHNGEYYIETGNRYTSFIRYYVDVQTEEKDNYFVVTFRIKEKEIGEGRSPIGVSYEMPFFSEDYLFSFLSKPTVEFKAEFDSPYNTESVYANFQRQLKTKTYKSGYKDPMTEKIFMNSFILPLDKNRWDSNAELFVEVYPYRNGTKTLITIHLPVKEVRTSENIDLGEIIKDVKKKIEEIIKS